MYVNLKRESLDAVFGMAYERVNWEDLPTALNARRKNLLFDGLGRLRQNRQQLIELLTDARFKADEFLGETKARLLCVLPVLLVFIFTPFLKIVLGLFLMVVLIVGIFGKADDSPPDGGSSHNEFF